jgi:hypothetical protein
MRQFKSRNIYMGLLMVFVIFAIAIALALVHCVGSWRLWKEKRRFVAR